MYGWFCLKYIINKRGNAHIVSTLNSAILANIRPELWIFCPCIRKAVMRGVFSGHLFHSRLCTCYEDCQVGWHFKLCLRVWILSTCTLALSIIKGAQPPSKKAHVHVHLKLLLEKICCTVCTIIPVQLACYNYTITCTCIVSLA